MTGTPPSDETPSDETSGAPVAVAEPPTFAPRRDEATLVERLRVPMPSRGLVGWIGPLVVTLIGGLLRFVDLGRPHDIIFDETYYPKDALSLLKYGYEQKFVENANALILGSNGDWRSLNLFTDAPNFVVHPPFGKWTIAVGEWLFGATPFGWRFSVAAVTYLGHATYATAVGWLRATVGTLPFVWLGARYGGAEGVLLGQTLGFALSSLMALALCLRVLRYPPPRLAAAGAAA